VNGVEFRVEHRKRVQCGSWYHIVTALTGSLDAVNDVFATPSVSSLNLILDEYSVQAATGN
jgi:hypothetical protein